MSKERDAAEAAEYYALAQRPYEPSGFLIPGLHNTAAQGFLAGIAWARANPSGRESVLVSALRYWLRSGYQTDQKAEIGLIEALEKYKGEVGE